MICLRAKISMISIRNLMYIKYSMARPQYQYSIYWMKIYFKEYVPYDGKVLNNLGLSSKFIYRVFLHFAIF